MNFHLYYCLICFSSTERTSCSFRPRSNEQWLISKFIFKISKVRKIIDLKWYTYAKWKGPTPEHDIFSCILNCYRHIYFFIVWPLNNNIDEHPIETMNYYRCVFIISRKLSECRMCLLFQLLSGARYLTICLEERHPYG